MPAPQSRMDPNFNDGISAFNSLKNFSEPAISISLRLPYPLSTPS